MDNKKDKYYDMLYMPHHVSTKRPRMDISDRAAQFSPFAVLTGHDAAIKETARLTERKRELSEEEKTQLDERLKIIFTRLKEFPEIKMIYFEADEKKSGGIYREVQERVYKIDYYNRVIVMENNLNVNFDDIYEIDGEIFQKVYNDYI